MGSRTIETFAPNDGQRLAMESLFIHLFHVYHSGSKPDFYYYANRCDELDVPMWVQNNLSAMADERQVKFKNGIDKILDSSCHLDWRPHVAR